MHRRKRRGSVSSPRHRLPAAEPLCVAAVPLRRVGGQSKRAAYQSPRPRRLSPGDREAVRVGAGRGRSLRELTADFGVSHETIRTVIREANRELPR